MAKASKQPEPAAEPVTLEQIAAKRLRERIEEYRGFVRRHAAGEVLDVAAMERVGELLEQIGLPDYAFARDAEATNRYAKAHAKWAAFTNEEPALRERAKQLSVEIKEATAKLAALKAEAHRVEMSTASKAASYLTSANQLKAEHPHVLADLATAVKLRGEALARRRAQVGVA